MPLYVRRSVGSLLDLNPGDHIQVDNTPRRGWLPSWANFTFGTTSSNAATARVVNNGHHMLVVRPINDRSVHVIHMTEAGVKEEDISLHAKNVTVLEYECTHTGEDAVENARGCFESAYDPLYSNDEQFVTDAKGVEEPISAATEETSSSQQTTESSENGLREIQSLFDLAPGDHIREETNTTYKHHLLVVRVIDVNRVRVIHKLDTGVVEEIKSYRPTQIRVLTYDSPYSEEEIIQRARELPRTPYHVRTSNCEHFVMEARTGERSSAQAQRGVRRAVVGGVTGIVAGVATGAVAGGVVGFIPGAVVGGILGAVGGGAAGVAGGAAVGVSSANRQN